MSDDLVIDENLVIPAAELRFSASRSSGPGGQHVNTADTRVELRWNVESSAALAPEQRERILTALAGRINRRGELVLSSGARRSQRQNRLAVQDRLVELLRRALAPRKPRRPTKPSAAAREKRLEQKRRRSSLKQQRGRPTEDD